MENARSQEALISVTLSRAVAAGIFTRAGECVCGNDLLLQGIYPGEMVSPESIHAESIEWTRLNGSPLIWDELAEAAGVHPVHLAVRLNRRADRVFHLHVTSLKGCESEHFLLEWTDATREYSTPLDTSKLEEHVSHVVRDMPQLVCVLDGNGVVQHWNEECVRATGYPASLMEGNPEALSILVPRRKQRQEIMRILSPRGDESIRQFIMEITCSDGSGKLVSWYSRYRKQPVLPGWYHWAVGVDVTHEMEVNRLLRQSEERLEMISRATHDALWDWNLLTDELWWNDGMTELFGHGEEEIGPNLGWWSDKLHPDYREQVLRKLEESIRGGDSFWTDEYLFRKKDGQYAYVADKGYVFHNAEGVPVRMIGGMIDLTRQTEAEKHAASRDDELRKILHFNSSRIRGPLGRIMQYSHMLAAMDHPGAAREVVDLMHQAARELEQSYKRLSVVADDYAPGED